MRRSLTFLTAVIALSFLSGCKPIVVPAPTWTNEIKIDDRTREPISRVVIKWSGDDLVWEKECPVCNGTKVDFGKKCGKCNGTGSIIDATGDKIFNLPIKGKINTTFEVAVYFVDGETVTLEHKTDLSPDERKLITVTIGKGRKMDVKEKKRNPHIQ